MGMVIVSIGFMLLDNDVLALAWALFNCWIWISAPLLILWAKEKEDKKEKKKKA